MTLLKTMLSAAFALTLAISSPLAAQGKSGEHGHGQELGQGVRTHTETHKQARAETSRVVTTRPVHRMTTTSTRATLPGWCRGRGNPHNTAANCGYRADRIYRERNGGGVTGTTTAW